jgi:hypothetical protein
MAGAEAVELGSHVEQTAWERLNIEEDAMDDGR